MAESGIKHKKSIKSYGTEEFVQFRQVFG
jgi:hypothetical protein